MCTASSSNPNFSHWLWDGFRKNLKLNRDDLHKQNFPVGLLMETCFNWAADWTFKQLDGSCSAES
jgi:hypothetical protein